MKILYAIQGTGNGHLSRARDIYPELAKYGTVDVLVSGIQVDVDFPYPIKYKFYGLSFIFGSHGGVDIWKTIKSMNLPRLIGDINKLKVREYDLVINDFEPVSAWACKLKRVPCISLSHQCAVLDKKAPLPAEHDRFGELVLRRYAPHTAAYGFHFKAFAKNIFTPVIRREIRELKPTNEGHITVYLPAYNDHDLIMHLSRFKKVKWQVFSKHNKESVTFENVDIHPIANDAFIRSMASSAGVLCGAGFEGPAEAMFLGKKLMVIPMHAQYEQQCNAAAMANMGVPVIKSLSKKYYDRILLWLDAGKPVTVDYPDQTAAIIARVIREQAPTVTNEEKPHNLVARLQ
ncbi:glycosyltransferase family protein [Chitinophagaceae bacterium MMS25-I14]